MAKEKLAMFYGDKPNTGQYDNGVWLDLLQIPFIQKLEEAGNYDTIIRTLWVEAAGWSKEIRDRFPHVKQIGLSDHPLSTHISRLDAYRQYMYLSDLQYLDGLMVLTEEERQFYQTALPHIPVIRVGLPFPIDSYEEKYGHLRTNEKMYIGLGVGAADNDRNFVSNLLAFRRLKIEYPEIVGVFLSIPHQLIQYCSFWADKIQDVYIHQREDMPEYYEMLTKCKFVFNLTDRNTPGRLQGEAAFFGVPVVGSNRLELQEELFPQFSVKPFEVEKAVQLGKWILENPVAADALTSSAKQRLEKNYNYTVSKRRFNKLLKQIKGEALVSR